MADDEIGTLGPKDAPGIDKDYLRAHTNRGSATVAPGPNAARVSKPGLTLPSEEVLSTENLLEVKMLRGYRPRTMRFEVGTPVSDEDGKETDVVAYKDPPEIEEGQDAGLAHKIMPGFFARLPKSEAQEVVRKGIAERADKFD